MPLVTLFFLVSPCYWQDAMPCQWSSTASATDLREHFLLSGVFYLTLLPAGFKASLGAGSSTAKLAGLHADLWNIAPAQLLLQMTAIHKGAIVVGSIYVSKASFEVRVPWLWNLPLTDFEPAFLKVQCVDSRLSWWIGYRVLSCEYNKWGRGNLIMVKLILQNSVV